MGTLSKLLLDQSTQFPSEPLLAPESLTNFSSLLKKIPSVTLFVTYCFYLFILNIYPCIISLFNAQILLSLRPEGKGGGVLLVKRGNVKIFCMM